MEHALLREVHRLAGDATHQKWLDKDAAEVDFDNLKIERAARGLTFAKWSVECKGKATASHVTQLEAFFGGKLLAKISDDDVAKYREKRSGETSGFL